MVKSKILFVILLISANVVAQNNTNDLFITFISESPHFKGNLSAFIMKNICYPPSAIKDSIEGQINVTFWIDTLGNTFNHKVIRSLREDLDREALRVTRLIKFDKPAMQGDTAISVRFTVPVIFSLKNLKWKARNNTCN